MYNPSSGFINALMRWPLIGGGIAAVSAVATDGAVAVASSFVAGSIVGAYGLTKLFKEQVCDCEKDGYMKIGEPKIDWIIEYSPETGNKRPWDVYSMFAGLEYTKQHYASYSTEEHALKKIEVLKKMVENAKPK